MVGFVIYVNNNEEIEELLEQFLVAETEYTEIFSWDNEESYAEILLLASSDYNIVMFMPLSLLEQYPQFNVNE